VSGLPHGGHEPGALFDKRGAPGTGEVVVFELVSFIRLQMTEQIRFGGFLRVVRAMIRARRPAGRRDMLHSDSKGDEQRVFRFV